METSNRPSRSDAHLSREEEAKIEGETRDYFDELAPRRHTKPQRSDYASQYVDDLPSDQDDGVSPEYTQFQHLEHNSQKLVYEGNEVTDEFVETEYYKDLNGVDKQHHTTGTGFIKVDDTKGSAFNLLPESDNEHHASSKGNPATNEWTPAPADTVYASGRNPWGKLKPDYMEKKGFVEANADDGLLEVFGFKQGWHASFVMVELISAKHIAQAAAIRFELRGGAWKQAFMQMDGEPWKQPLKNEFSTFVDIERVPFRSVMINGG